MSTWGNAVKHNVKASWIRREQTRASNVRAMEYSPVTTKQVSRLIAKTLNWKALGTDAIIYLWIKRFAANHSYLAHHFNQFVEDAGNIPEFLVQGITQLLSKRQDSQDPSKYRPITCLCTITRGSKVDTVSGVRQKLIYKTHKTLENQKQQGRLSGKPTTTSKKAKTM